MAIFGLCAKIIHRPITFQEIRDNTKSIQVDSAPNPVHFTFKPIQFFPPHSHNPSPTSTSSSRNSVWTPASSLVAILPTDANFTKLPAIETATEHSRNLFMNTCLPDKLQIKTKLLRGFKCLVTFFITLLSLGLSPAGLQEPVPPPNPASRHVLKCQ